MQPAFFSYPELHLLCQWKKKNWLVIISAPDVLCFLQSINPVLCTRQTTMHASLSLSSQCRKSCRAAPWMVCVAAALMWPLTRCGPPSGDGEVWQGAGRPSQPQPGEDVYLPSPVTRMTEWKYLVQVRMTSAGENKYAIAFSFCGAKTQLDHWGHGCVS